MYFKCTLWYFFEKIHNYFNSGEALQFIEQIKRKFYNSIQLYRWGLRQVSDIFSGHLSEFIFAIFFTWANILFTVYEKRILQCYTVMFNPIQLRYHRSFETLELANYANHTDKNSTLHQRTKLTSNLMLVLKLSTIC